MKRFILFLVILVFILQSCNFVYAVTILNPDVKIYPSSGSILTDIYVQIRGISGICYLYWDNMFIGTYDAIKISNINGFDIHFNPPNDEGYVDLGNHVIMIKIYDSTWGGINIGVIDFYAEKNMNFSIEKYYPPTSDWWKWWYNVPDDIKSQLKGDRGTQGEKGIKGDIGLQGDQGEQGIQGIQGIQGLQGRTPLNEVYIAIGISIVALFVSLISMRKNKSSIVQKKLIEDDKK